MRRPAGMALLIVAIGSIWAWYIQPGLTPSERLLLWRQDSRPFTPDAWRTADATARGAMLRDLVRRTQLIDAKNEEVFRLLGPSNCYADYEDEPCYVVELSGSKRSFALAVNHSDRPGTVVGLGLESY